MGYDLLVNVLHKLCPTDIVQLDILDSPKNIPSELATLFEGNISVHSVEAYVSKNSRLNASEHRLLSLASYFMKISDNSFDFTSLRLKIPYEIAYENFYVKFMFDDVFYFI